MNQNDLLPKKLQKLHFYLAGARLEIKADIPAIAKRIQDIDNLWDKNPERWVSERETTFREVYAIIGEIVNFSSAVASADALRGGSIPMQPPNVTRAIRGLKKAQDILVCDNVKE